MTRVLKTTCIADVRLKMCVCVCVHTLVRAHTHAPVYKVKNIKVNTNTHTSGRGWEENMGRRERQIILVMFYEIMEECINIPDSELKGGKKSVKRRHFPFPASWSTKANSCHHSWKPHPLPSLPCQDGLHPLNLKPPQTVSLLHCFLFGIWSKKQKNNNTPRSSIF